MWRHGGLFEPTAILGSAPPAVAEGIVVVAYSSGEAFGLLLDSGRPIWTDSVLRPRRGLAVDTISDITAAPVIDGGRVYIAGASGELAADELSRGTRQWDADLTAYSTPWLAGDFLYIVTPSGELASVLRQGGHIRWVTRVADAVGDEDLDSSVLWSGPIMVGGKLVLVGSSGGHSHLFAARWQLLGRADAGDGSRLGPVAADGIIYVLTEDGDIVAFR